MKAAHAVAEREGGKTAFSGLPRTNMMIMMTTTQLQLHSAIPVNSQNREWGIMESESSRVDYMPNAQRVTLNGDPLLK